MEPLVKVLGGDEGVAVVVRLGELLLDVGGAEPLEGAAGDDEAPAGVGGELVEQADGVRGGGLEVGDDVAEGGGGGRGGEAAVVEDEEDEEGDEEVRGVGLAVFVEERVPL